MKKVNKFKSVLMLSPIIVDYAYGYDYITGVSHINNPHTI